MTDADRQRLGCIGDKAVIPSILDGEQITVCPKRFYCDRARELDPVLERWLYAQRGQLPEPGLWNEQPAMLVECFRVIEAALADAEKVLARQRQARAKAEAAHRAGAGKTPAPQRKLSHPGASRRPS